MILVLLPLIVLVIAAVLLLVLRVLRPASAYAWLSAAAAAVLAWGAGLALSGQLPLNLALADWQPRQLLPVSPALLADGVSWPLLQALLALNLAVVLTGVLQPEGRHVRAASIHLAAGFVLTALAGLAVLAGNLLTLLLLWGLLDLAESLIWLAHARGARQSESVVVHLSVRLGSAGLLAWAGIVAYSSGQGLDFAPLAPQIGPYLLAAGGLRLGALPYHPPLPRRIPVNAGLLVLLRLAPAGAALLALVRGAASVTLPEWVTPLLFLAGVAIGLGAWAWAIAPNALEGLPAWRSAAGGLALAAALRGQPAAALAWGLALLLLGGLLALAWARPRPLRGLLLLAVLAFTALPFTPTWPGVNLYALPLHLLLLLVLIGQALLLAGLARQMLLHIPLSPQAERWVWLVYPLGLLLLLITWGLVVLLPGGGLLGERARWPGAQESVVSAIALGLALAAFALLAASQRKRKRLTAQRRWQSLLDLRWIYALAWWLYRWIGRLMGFISRRLEGQAGLLWALLVLALLLSLLAQLGIGN